MKLFFRKSAKLSQDYLIELLILLRFFEIERDTLTLSKDNKKLQCEEILKESEPLGCKFLKVLQYTISEYPEVFNHLFQTHFEQTLGLIGSLPPGTLRELIKETTFLMFKGAVEKEVALGQRPIIVLVDLLLHYYKEDDEDDQVAIFDSIEQFLVDSSKLSLDDINQLLRINIPQLDKLNLLSQMFTIQSKQHQKLVEILKNKRIIPEDFN
eukprot:TRINITY_DN4396_c0_g1_i1.p1 TRINITY_DN4396_c0_g1~~TRINITY_DN4396_c0_g1_i1.p1  ORF type:complete len:211 (-),score=34.12 TRINITY_DN4396_c0_g1_i1:58-690(-)